MALDISTKEFLIVDDFPEMRIMLKRMLSAFGVTKINDAKDGPEALKILSSKQVDAVLCDYNLGDGKDGQQILEEAKYKGLIANSTIFMMITAENTLDMVMGAVEYQPDDYLTKPFNKTVLRARLEKVFEKKIGLAEVDKALQKKDYSSAIAICDVKISENAKNFHEFARLKGDICLSTNRYSEAEKVYTAILAQRNVPWAEFGLGKVKFHQKNYDEARAIFQQLIDRNRAFVHAYDWLAKINEAEGNMSEAQRLLAEASRMSPKAILRQKALAEVSVKNQDYDTAETAYRKVVRNGKNSCFKHPTDYSGLATVLVKKQASTEALKIAGSIRKEFQDRPDSALYATVAESNIYKATGRDNDAQQAFSQAEALFATMTAQPAPDLVIQLAKTCFDMGKKEQGENFIKNMIRNNHEDSAVLDQARQLFNDLGLQQEGETLIDMTCQEVIEVNNRGVQLAMEGSLDESINLFTQAAEKMPNNVTVNLNAAQSLIMLLQKQNGDEQLSHRAKQYLDRVGQINPGNEKYQKLLGAYSKLTGQR